MRFATLNADRSELKVGKKKVSLRGHYKKGIEYGIYSNHNRG